ncbi:MAG TPA: glucan biosynthesis protein G [candidate division Zixibacteria bacterium]|nr:glucan biosynthesis protein G [candidate division Zixibacteria bacterium]
MSLALFLLAPPAFGNARFGFDEVSRIARKLAAEAFRPPQQIPDFLKQVTYDEYRDIRFRTEHSLWRDSGGNFQIQFIHPGLYYTHSVGINVLNENGVYKVPFSPKLFDYGRNKFGSRVPVDLGFAGFRITYPFYRRSEQNHVLVFAGASYFRAVARHQVFGLSARGLAIDTGLPTGEEFPSFREFWIERPARSAQRIRLYALLDSPSLAGAYEFVLRPGDRTVVEVRGRLFERRRVRELGIAPLTSMFLFGEEKARTGDWRPEVHDSDGLLIASSTGEWIWRPLVNPERLRVSYFHVDNPRGFGLLQRDRRFQSYEDLETRPELRPNAWIKPIGNWGSGYVKLVEIPSPKEINDNIVAYWIPKSLPQVGQPIDFAYRIQFQSEDPLEPSSGRATATRIGRGDREDLLRFVVDFDGGKLRALSAGAPVRAVISVGADGQLVQQNVFKNPVTRGWRAAFQIRPPGDKPLELRAFLQNGGDTLTETWAYRVDP